MQPILVTGASGKTGNAVARQLLEGGHPVRWDALQLPFAPASFDCVTMHHVAMHIADRAALYAGIRRVLADGGRLVTYDVVRGAGDARLIGPEFASMSANFRSTLAQGRAAIVAVVAELA